MQLLGVIFSVCGAYIVVTAFSGNTESSEPSIFLGVFCTLMQLMAKSLVLVIQKPMLERYDPALVTCIFTCIGAVIAVSN